MSRGVSKENRRLGMSVQEIYDALDQLDRLKEAYTEKQAEYASLKTAIDKTEDYIFRTSETYRRVANSSDDYRDKLEFLGKSSGLIEAWMVLRKNLKGEAEWDGKENDSCRSE